MFFIAKGDCVVVVRDERKEEAPIKILKEGDLFGEISMIYKCRRSATVISRNYNTMAKLTENSFKSLVSEYPEFLKFLKAHLQTYRDKKKLFLKSTV